MTDDMFRVTVTATGWHKELHLWDSDAYLLLSDSHAIYGSKLQHTIAELERKVRRLVA